MAVDVKGKRSICEYPPNMPDSSIMLEGMINSTELVYLNLQKLNTTIYNLISERKNLERQLIFLNNFR